MRMNISKNVITFSYVFLILGIISALGIGGKLGVASFIGYLVGTLIMWVILYSLGKILQHQEMQTAILRKLQSNIYEVEEIDSTNDD